MDINFKGFNILKSCMEEEDVRSELLLDIATRDMIL